MMITFLLLLLAQIAPFPGNHRPAAGGPPAFYIDTVNGNDANAGTIGSPWKTFKPATQAASNAVIRAKNTGAYAIVNFPVAGLFGKWAMAGLAGGTQTVPDQSGWSNLMQLGSTSGVDAATDPAIVAGGLSFSSGKYATVTPNPPNGYSLNPATIGLVFTHPATETGDKWIMNYGGDLQLSFYIGSTTQVINLFTSSGNDSIAESSGSPTSFHNLAVTWDGVSSYKIYWDGTFVRTITKAGALAGDVDSKVVIGGRLFGNQYTGVISDAYVFSRSLSATEVAQVASNMTALVIP